jgi:cation transporter-like permease
MPNAGGRRQARLSREAATAIVVEEYRALRAKSAEARNNQQTILQWSLALVGVVIAGSLALAGDPFTQQVRLLVTLALALPVPLILAAAWGAWLAEIDRMRRAAAYIREIETAGRAALRTSADHVPLVWEHRLKNVEPIARHAPVAICGLYVSLIAMSLLTSFYLALGSSTLVGHALWAYFAAVALPSGTGVVLSLWALRIGRHFYR